MANIFHAIVLFIVAFLPHGGNVSHLTAKLIPTPTIVISSTSTPTPTPTVTVVETQALIQPTDTPTPALQNCVINGQTYTLSPQDCQNTEDAIKGDQQIISNYQQSFKDYANDQSKIWTQVPTVAPFSTYTPTPTTTPILASTPNPNIPICQELAQELESTAGSIVAEYARRNITGGVVNSAIVQGTMNICSQLKMNGCSRDPSCQ